ncbi:ABC transporter permease [Clostridioides difficile]|nr:ABC transporter permease [Clostridioides difficile]
MKIIDYLKLSYSNLKKRKIRTLINIFSIAIGVTLIVTLVSLGSGLKSYVMSQIKELNNLQHVSVYNTKVQSSEELEKKLAKTDANGDIDVENLYEKKKINDTVINSLSKDKRISQLLVKYETELTETQYGDKKIKEIKAVSYDKDFYLKSEKASLKQKKEADNSSLSYILEGRELNNKDKNAVMLPESFVKNTLGIDNPKDIIGKEISLKSVLPDFDKDKIFDRKATIVGVINKKYYQPSFVISKDLMTDIKNFEEGGNKSLKERGADVLELSITKLENVEKVVSYIEHSLGYTTESVQSVAKIIEKILLGINIILSVVGIITILVASLGVINTMIMSINERTKMIGLMKATGASKVDILCLFLVESSVIGLLGGCLGSFLSYFNLLGIKGIITYILESLEINQVSFLDKIVNMNLSITILTICFAVVLTMLAGLYPSIKASKLNPIEALKFD